jgi:IS5 family transposase
LGKEQMEWLLTKSIQASVKVEMVKPQSFEQVIVDTTVMEKAITHPTDSRRLKSPVIHTRSKLNACTRAKRAWW